MAKTTRIYSKPQSATSGRTLVSIRKFYWMNLKCSFPNLQCQQTCCSGSYSGLDVNSSLSSCLTESYFDSQLVIALFYIQRRTDGHWITPHHDLPLTLHGELLSVPMLLSHGKLTPTKCCFRRASLIFDATCAMQILRQ